MDRTAAAIAVIILISVVIKCSSSKTLLADAASSKPFEHELEDSPASTTTTDLDAAASPPVKMSKDAPLIPGCPLCDSSVFSYCDVKIYHDACCCGLSLPQCAYQQQSQGCQMLYANSCQEHRLIMQCCCYNPQYRQIE